MEVANADDARRRRPHAVRQVLATSAAHSRRTALRPPPDCGSRPIGRATKPAIACACEIDAPLVAENDRAKLEAAIVVPDGRRLPLALEPDPTVADAYVAEFDAVAPGRYRVSLAATVDGQAAAETSAAIEVIAARGETDDAGVDRAALAEIARRTGGRVVDPDDRTTWPTSASGPTPEVEVRRHVHLCDNFTLLTLLCLVLGGDWLIRLMRGYV